MRSLPYILDADIAVIGGGIAGVAVASALARHASVVLIEAETHLGSHSTGRSAALFSETYGAPLVRALSRASRPEFTNPTLPVDGPLASPRGAMLIADDAGVTALNVMRAHPDIAAATVVLDGAAARRIVPILADCAVAAAVLEPGAMDIDVAALQQGYLRAFKSNGGHVIQNARVNAIEFDSAALIRTDDRTIRASLVVNAAGAWADEIAKMAGVRSAGLVPMRRTVAVIDAPDGFDISGWPMVVDAKERFYFKSDAGRLLVSPADETPSPPCDCQPDDYDVAVGIDYYEQATSRKVARVRARWAGLRTFTADRLPAVGFDDERPGFFWLAGQGGYGVQTAPALSRLAASQILSLPMPEDLFEHGVDPLALHVRRLQKETI